MSGAAIELEHLTKDYGSFRALDGISASVPLGRVGLLGPNGAGKSTLVKCLLGLVRPSGGRARVLGLDVAERPLLLRQRIGYLPEVDCHIPGMTAVEFVRYAGELCGMPGSAALTRAHEVLDYVGLREERYRLVDGFSTGMRQKVKLAQALVHDPKLLLLDEPTNGLDPPGRERMLELILDLSRNGIAILYSSHLLADVERICDEVVMLREGRLLAQGRVDELLRGRAGHFEVRAQGDLAGLIGRLEQAGLACREDAPGRLRLEGDAASVPDLVLRAACDTPGVQLRALRPVRFSLEEAFLEALQGEDEA